MTRGGRRTSKALVRTDLEPLPVMFVCGEERALVDAAVAHVRHAVLAGGMAELNHDRLAGRSNSPEQIIACARTLPVMAPRRLVEVSDGEALGAAALEKIADYAAAPVQEAVLLIVARDVDKRTRAARALDKLGCLFRYQHLEEETLVGLCAQLARKHDLELGEEAAAVLVMAVGSELQLIERALEKLALVCEGGRARPEDVEEHVSQTRVESIFNLTEAIASGDRGAAMTVLGQMLDAREQPLRILGTLTWQQRQLIRARDVLDHGGGPSEVRQAVRVRFFDRFLHQVRAVNARRAAAGLVVIERTDRALKSSRARPRALLERAVLELAELR